VGSSSNVSSAVFLFGSTTPFTAEKLEMLCPTHEEYVSKVKDAARKAREGGFILEPEERLSWPKRKQRRSRSE
jgi:Alpha/beta hydrolase domain